MSRLLAMLLILPSLCWGTFDHSYPSYAKLLQAYVSPHGMVNYRQLTENHEEASDVLQQFEAVSPTEFSTWNREQQLSFLINAYNMATIELIVSHYPSDSIRDLGGVFTNPFKLTFFSLLQKKQSLDGIEHGIIRANYREARIHFALVCASQSCPQLRSEPYIPEQLEAQLFSQTQQFLQESTKNTFDLEQKKAQLSKIFSWYKKDFIAASGSVKNFILPYLPQQISAELPQLKVSYLSYDWSLNDWNLEANSDSNEDPSTDGEHPS